MVRVKRAREGRKAEDTNLIKVLEALVVSQSGVEWLAVVDVIKAFEEIGAEGGSVAGAPGTV